MVARQNQFNMFEQKLGLDEHIKSVQSRTKDFYDTFSKAVTSTPNISTLDINNPSSLFQSIKPTIKSLDHESMIEMVGYIDAKYKGSFENLNVSQLKIRCREMNLPTGGLKKDLR